MEKGITTIKSGDYVVIYDSQAYRDYLRDPTTEEPLAIVDPKYITGKTVPENPSDYDRLSEPNLPEEYRLQKF